MFVTFLHRQYFVCDAVECFFHKEFGFGTRHERMFIYEKLSTVEFFVSDNKRYGFVVASSFNVREKRFYRIVRHRIFGMRQNKSTRFFERVREEEFGFKSGDGCFCGVEDLSYGSGHTYTLGSR